MKIATIASLAAASLATANSNVLGDLNIEQGRELQGWGGKKSGGHKMKKMWKKNKEPFNYVEYSEKVKEMHKKVTDNLGPMCTKKFKFGEYFCDNSPQIEDCALWNDAKQFSCDNFAICEINSKFQTKLCMGQIKGKMQDVFKEVKNFDIIPDEEFDPATVDGTSLGDCFDAVIQDATDCMVERKKAVVMYKDMTADLTKPSAEEMKNAMKAFKKGMKKAKKARRQSKKKEMKAEWRAKKAQMKAEWLARKVASGE